MTSAAVTAAVLGVDHANDLAELETDCAPHGLPLAAGLSLSSHYLWPRLMETALKRLGSMTLRP